VLLALLCAGCAADAQRAAHQRQLFRVSRMPTEVLRESLRLHCISGTLRCSFCYRSRQPRHDGRAAEAMNRVVISTEALDRFRAVASQFARGTASRASRLLSVKDDIAALRKKGASYRTISELLTQSGIAASDTCVMRFCHRVLEEKRERSRPRKASAAPRATSNTANGVAPKTALDETAQAALLDDLLRAAPPSSPAPPKTDDGPRIARIQFANPDDL
jgi:hypothetical protein